MSKSNSPVDMVVPPKSPGGTKDLKTTTIVMSKHTLAPQNPNVSVAFSINDRSLGNDFLPRPYLFANKCVADLTIVAYARRFIPSSLSHFRQLETDRSETDVSVAEAI